MAPAAVVPRGGVCLFLVLRRRLSKSSLDAQLRSGERSATIALDAISRIDVSQLAANSPIEDFFSAAKCLSSDAFLFGVFDGHAGASCSRQVSTRLYDYVCASVLAKHLVSELGLNQRLQWLFSSADPALPPLFREQHERNLHRFHREFIENPQLSTVRKALQAAFNALDNDISDGAMPDMKGHICRYHFIEAIIDVVRMSASVAAAGSCAVMAHVRKANLHIANIGDSAAVLGVSAHGGITARQLSRPHCVDNPDEVRRIRSSHPNAESAQVPFRVFCSYIFQVLKGGRLLGELFPLRAFGDVRYKWPADVQRVVLGPLGIQAPIGLLTPPYLIASPEVFYHQLTSNDRFLVLASDGLWEFLEPDTVVKLVSDHAVGAQTLTQYRPPAGAMLRQVRLELSQRRLGQQKKPLDENSATHIIRHAIGGCSGTVDEQYERLAAQLQLPPGVARDHRDDLTVIVIHFNDQYLASSEHQAEHT